MPTDTEQILRDADGSPIPQVWDEVNGVFAPLEQPSTEDTFTAQMSNILSALATLSTESKLEAVRALLAALLAAAPGGSGVATEITLAAVLAKLTAGIPLDATTLAALETIQVGNFPATQPVSVASLPLPAGAATQTTLAAVLAQLAAGIPLDATTLAALETIQVGNFPATQAVSAASLPLPTGASTETTQAAQNVLAGAVTETAPASDTASSGLNGRLQRIAQRLTSLIALLPAALSAGGGVKVGVVDAFPAGTNNIGDVDVLTLPALPAGTNNIGDVDIVSSALPTGAATETTLAAASGKLPASLGIKADAASLSVALSTEQRTILVAQATDATLAALSAKLPASLGLKADAASLSVGLSTEQRAIIAAIATETTLAALSAKLPASLGIKADAASVSVGLSTEQRAILVAQATETTLAALSAKLPASLGIKADAASFSVGLSTEQRAILAALLTQSDFDTKAGALTETAPATDIASSGLNGRLQRLAQHLSTLIAALPTLDEPWHVSPPNLNGTDDTLRSYLPYPDVFMDASGNVLQVKYAVFSSIAATTTIVTAVAGKRIEVLSMHIDYGAAAGDITIQDSTGTPVVLDRLHAEAAWKPLVLPRGAGPYYRTEIGKALNIVTPAGVTAMGGCAYIDGTTV